MENTNNTNEAIIINGKEYVKLNDTEAKEVREILASINMTESMFYSMDEAAQKSVFSCALATFYKQNLEKAKSAKTPKVQKSIHWASKTTVEVKCIKAFIQGFKYLSGFVQNNGELLNNYTDDKNANLADIIEASIDKLLAENHSNFKKGSEKVKYSDADYQSVSLFISKLLKDKNADLYKWLLQSKLACYEKIVYTSKDKQDNKQNNRN